MRAEWAAALSRDLRQLGIEDAALFVDKQQERISELEQALKCLLPGLVLDLRYAKDDYDKDAFRNRISIVHKALGL